MSDSITEELHNNAKGFLNLKLKMENLPSEICLKIFVLLDHQSLAAAQQVCRKWKALTSDNNLWANLFKERWGGDRAAFFDPAGVKTWKDVYEVQDSCERIGLGLKITREGRDYYLVHQGEIQCYLGSKRPREGTNNCPLISKREYSEEGSQEEGGACRGILDKILFFIGDLEVASTDAKRGRLL